MHPREQRACPSRWKISKFGAGEYMLANKPMIVLNFLKKYGAWEYPQEDEQEKKIESLDYWTGEEKMKIKIIEEKSTTNRKFAKGPSTSCLIRENK